MYQSSPSRHKDKNWEAEEPSADQKSLASEDGDEPSFGVYLKEKIRRLSSTGEQLKLKTMGSLVSISHISFSIE